MVVREAVLTSVLAIKGNLAGVEEEEPGLQLLVVIVEEVPSLVLEEVEEEQELLEQEVLAVLGQAMLLEVVQQD